MCRSARGNALQPLQVSILVGSVFYPPGSSPGSYVFGGKRSRLHQAHAVSWSGSKKLCVRAETAAWDAARGFEGSFESPLSEMCGPNISERIVQLLVMSGAGGRRFVALLASLDCA
mmetsp:Transcript_855/g.1286  ORF Transcript_855/g.1286 Transcript_855/m.1286 type:complete len:116 (-) Transcript_855:1199-1546(-)